MQKIIPHLWFDKSVEEAVGFYTSTFQGGTVHATMHYSEVGHEIHGMDAGTVLTVEFEIEGYRLVALNGGPLFTLTPAISFMVNFDPLREPRARERLDEVWEKLSEGGRVLMPLDAYPFSTRYGWVEDKYGVSWQLILTNPEGEERPVIIPSLMYVTDAGETAESAIAFYCSVFKDARQGQIARYPAGMEPNKEGAIMFADFMLENQWFAAMDANAKQHTFSFNEAVSLLVLCRDQTEIDYYWEKLSAVPDAEQCGWLKDQYGVSWQIIPHGMDEMLNDPDREKADRAMQAMLAMKKIDIAQLRAAYEGTA